MVLVWNVKKPIFTRLLCRTMEYRNLTVAHLRVLHPDVNRNIEYHVLSSYCSTNKEKINVILGFLKSLGCRVNDPDSFFVPGQFIFKNIIENGIDKTKMTVLFITKDFVKSSWCSYVANQAVWKSVVTKGKYRVIPIILESCRLPKYLRSLNCVHLWKYLRSSAVENGDVQSCIVRGRRTISESDCLWVFAFVQIQSLREHIYYSN